MLSTRVTVATYVGSATADWLEVGISRTAEAKHAVNVEGEATFSSRDEEETARVLTHAVDDRLLVEAPTDRPQPIVQRSQANSSIGSERRASDEEKHATIAAMPAPETNEVADAPAPAAPAPELDDPKNPTTDVVAPQAESKSSALSLESSALGVAVRKLHSEHDAAAALSALDAYRAAHAKGLLWREAEAVRVDALMSLGRHKETLAVLDRLSIQDFPRARELGIVRGELRLEAGRCKEAIADFETGLSGLDSLAERARYGRAVCRARAGDKDGARGDLERYLSEFPEGQFASKAREALSK